MAIDQVLLLILNHLSKHKKLVVSWAAIQLWQPKAFELLLKNHVIKPTDKANNIQCQICEKHCTVDVTRHDYPNNKIRYYAMCLDDYMHEQVGRMTIPPEQLNQWQCSTKQLIKILSRLLSIDKEPTFSINTEQTRLAMLAKKAGRKWVTLIHYPLALEINQMILPLEEILYFDGNSLALDIDRVNYALNLKQPAQEKGYSPNVNKRDKGKFNTQAMHQDWQDEAIRLKKKYPNHNKTWISKQIAKLSIAQERSAETIRKSIDV
jgi:transcription elongation factor Elf1